jgi:hypothetical protein
MGCGRRGQVAMIGPDAVAAGPAGRSREGIGRGITTRCVGLFAEKALPVACAGMKMPRLVQVKEAGYGALYLWVR